jgi:hypothetical protein
MAAGVLADMRAGKRVLVLSESQNFARQAFQEVLGSGLESWETPRRANGRERIEGRVDPEGKQGTIFFRSIHAILRGIAVDVVIADVDWNALDPAIQFEIKHALACCGELIRR